MTNNDVLRRLRYTFQFKDQQVVNVFALANRQVTVQQVIAWLKPDDDAEILPLSDSELASFLNGFIVEKRGRSDKPVPTPEKQLTKNLILKKLKIALNLTSDDIIALLAKMDVTIGNAELTAFFRKPEHKNYRHCKSQFLRNFLMALQLTHRPNVENKPAKTQSEPRHKTTNNVQHTKAKHQTAKKRYDNPNASPYATFEKKTERKVLSIKGKNK
ncbi:DUF1456 family protein [Thalassotalea sediminis]|uniref:DUF1456 family protein n=1 Tax=Thalassotalea sediminis TaxID=1759089 RepID=UPI002573FA83|nr:DUF1456 family protein [Thalassotalea sediminis]